MKKITGFLLLLLLTISCSEYESDVILPASNEEHASRPGPVIGKLDPTILWRVIFYPGTTYERQWFFYPNGLLKKIQQPNGTLIQDFYYDSHKNLISTHFFGDPFFTGSPYSHTFGYNASNYITSVDGSPVIYDAFANTYLVRTVTIHLNSELLMTSESYSYFDDEEPGQPPVEYTVYGLGAGYSNGNNTYHWQYDSPSATHYLHDANTNPFKASVLPITRALGITAFNNFRDKWMEGIYISQNNVIKRYYETEDPESDLFEYKFNSIGLPTKQTRKSYYFQTLENTSTDILYYYQGETVPN